jgi:arginase family enzyme
MLAVDHSLTGGAFRRLVELYSPEKMSLIVLDSHTDAIPVSIMSDAIRYDIETNKNSVHDPDDPFLVNRAESYNACSFLHYLMEEGAVEPENLYLIGISDYPPKRSFRIKDQRIKHYVASYTGLKKKGVKILTKKDLITSPSKVRALLGGIETPYLYISIDMDIGARNALEAVRFRNWQGLNERQLYAIADSLMELLSQGTCLAGMDLTEINPRRTGPNSLSGGDRTYQIALNLIKKLGFGIKEAR